MTYVLSAKAFSGMNIETVLGEVKGSYFHIAPSITKAAVLNLGMTKEELMSLVNMNYSLNIFDEGFSTQQLKAVPHDVLMISNGQMDSDMLPEVVEKLKGYMGKKTILGVGLGKDLIAMALKELDEELTKDGSVLKNEKYKVFCIDGSMENDFGNLTQYIV
jgi:carbamoylphosphate synthase small subunit